MDPHPDLGSRSPFRRLNSEAGASLALVGAAAAAMVVANSPFASVYSAALHHTLGPLPVAEWINDGLMALFFLLVGLEIKRELAGGRLSSWSQRSLPLLGTLGGMIVPALIFACINWSDPGALRGWAIPCRTDIAFALALTSALGRQVPRDLKVFLTALAIIDDLGAVLIIAFFYTSRIALLDLGIVFASLLAAGLGGVVLLSARPATTPHLEMVSKS